MRPRRHVLTSVVMVPFALVVALPFYYILVNTFKTQQQTTEAPLALPSGLYLQNYITAWQDNDILRGFLNTLIVTALSLVIMLAFGAAAAYGMVIGRGRLAAIVGGVLVLAFVVPAQATLLPLYRMLVNVHLVDNLLGLVVLYSQGAIFCYFLILGYMRTIPRELLEAARVDGAGSLRIFWAIVLPLIRPILVTVGVFQTMWVWNDFIYPNVFISSTSNQTLVLQVYAAVGQFTTNWPAFMTLTVIVLIPMLVFFLVLQRHIVSGLVQGSVKG